MKITILITIFLMLSLVGHTEELKMLSSYHTHEPEFSCKELWKVGETEVTTRFEKGNHLHEFKLEGWPQGEIIYRQNGSPFNTIKNIYYMDVNDDGVKEFIALSYNGSANGDYLLYWNQVDFWFKDGSRVNTYIKDFKPEKIISYYKDHLRSQ